GCRRTRQSEAGCRALPGAYAGACRLRAPAVAGRAGRRRAVPGFDRPDGFSARQPCRPDPLDPREAFPARRRHHLRARPWPAFHLRAGAGEQSLRVGSRAGDCLILNRHGRDRPGHDSKKGYAPEYFTTYWSMAPKIDLPAASHISMRMRSPNFMNGVFGLPSLFVSIMRIAARQEKPFEASLFGTVPLPTMAPARGRRVLAAWAIRSARLNCMSAPASGSPN